MTLGDPLSNLEDKVVTMAPKKFDEAEYKKHYGRDKQYKNIEDIFEHGVLKPFTILWRPRAGNDLFYYDENFNLIFSLPTLWKSKYIICTNYLKHTSEPLKGIILMDERKMRIAGCPTRKGFLVLRYNGVEHQFKDELSFLSYYNSTNKLRDEEDALVMLV